MKNLFTKTNTTALTAVCLFCLVVLMQGCKKKNDALPPKLTVTTLAAGFESPLGLEVDKMGRVWVTETGTGHGDGSVSVINPNGQKYKAIINLKSIITPDGETEGPSHLLFADGLLYITGAKGLLYKANVTSFVPGSAPIVASTLAVEDVGAFVLAYPFKNNTHETHPYGLTQAPDGDIYITDAAANAIIRRSKSGVLSIVAEVPGIPNPTPVGPPFIQSVPTGVIFNDGKLLVSTLMGFPFPPGKSIIYQIKTNGETSVYQEGFTSTVDIIKGGAKGKMVVQFGVFGATGFAPNSGKVIWANGTTAIDFVTGLNQPDAIVQANETTWYVTSLGNSSVLKITFE